jgi:hypothetical protein
VIAVPVLFFLARRVRRRIICATPIMVDPLRGAGARRQRRRLRLLLGVLVTSVRVVSVGHALVIFNTVTKGFRLSSQGVTFVWPVISQTRLRPAAPRVHDVEGQR